ncbi:MAG: hypothetical protein CMI12_01190 [Oceanospirillum sp.]|nr:hypothetical protein [Oceanospirillum sp.]
MRCYDGVKALQLIVFNDLLVTSYKLKSYAYTLVLGCFFCNLDQKNNSNVCSKMPEPLQLLAFRLVG